MRTIRLSAVALVLFLLGFAAARADDAKAAKKKEALTGRLVCIGCHLEKEFGADAQCTLHAKHAQGFLADDGTLYTILDNGRGHILITEKKLLDAPIRLECFTFPKTQVLEAIRFSKKDGEKWVQYDYCKNCGFEPGDHAGRDLCDDCAK